MCNVPRGTLDFHVPLPG